MADFTSRLLVKCVTCTTYSVTHRNLPDRFSLVSFLHLSLIPLSPERHSEKIKVAAYRVSHETTYLGRYAVKHMALLGISENT